MKKLYGSLNNRLDENKYYNGTNNNLEVGTLATVYYYSDRHAYEVVEVKDQKHIKIRQLEATRVDNNGMSDSQHYEYSSNEKNLIIELVLKNNVWYKVIEYSKEIWLKVAEQLKEDFKGGIKQAYNYVRYMASLTENQYNKIEDGKIVKKYSKMNISFGIADEHFDYSF